MGTEPDQLSSVGTSVGICEQFASLLNEPASLDESTQLFKASVPTGDFIVKQVVQLLMSGSVPPSFLEPYVIGSRDIVVELQEVLDFYVAKGYLFPPRGDNLEPDVAAYRCDRLLGMAETAVMHIREERAKASYGLGRGAGNGVDFASALSQATPALANKLGELLTPYFVAITNGVKSSGGFHTISGTGSTDEATVVRTPEVGSGNAMAAPASLAPIVGALGNALARAVKHEQQQ